MPVAEELADRRDQHHVVEHRTPDRATKPTPAEMVNGMPRSHSASDAADRGERHAGEDPQGVAHAP